MTAATLTPTAAASIPSDARLTFARVVRSEWIKLTSLRSTIWSLALIVVLGVGLSTLVVTLNTFTDAPPASDPSAVLTTVTIGTAFGQLIAAVLGVLVMSGEYSTGMIRSTFTAVPNRLQVLAAKALTLFAIVTVTGAVTMFGAWAATYPILDAQGAAVPLTESGFAVALVGAALYLGLTAVFALGLGTALRSAAGGIGAALGVMLVLPTVLPLLGLVVDWVADVTPYLFSNAGNAMARLAASESTGALGSGLLEPGIGDLVVLAWTLVSLAIGALVLRGRDA